MNSFQASAWFEYQFWWEEVDANLDDFQVCIGLGWSVEDILFEVVMNQIFQDCTKTIIDNIEIFPLPLFGEEAEPLFEWDDCTSSGEEEIELYVYDELMPNDRDEYLVGAPLYSDADANCFDVGGSIRLDQNG